VLECIGVQGKVLAWTGFRCLGWCSFLGLDEQEYRLVGMSFGKERLGKVKAHGALLDGAMRICLIWGEVNQKTVPCC
jgi:hypothetical protein